MEIQHRFDFDDLDLRIEPAHDDERPPSDCTGQQYGTTAGDSIRTYTTACSPGCRI